jgi:hypothetical protein
MTKPALDHEEARPIRFPTSGRIEVPTVSWEWGRCIAELTQGLAFRASQYALLCDEWK